MSRTRQDVDASAPAAAGVVDNGDMGMVASRARAYAPQLFWLLHIGGWAAYFLLGFSTGLAHDKPMGYWKLPLAQAISGLVATLGLRYWLRSLWHLPPAALVAAIVVGVLAASAVMGVVFVAVLIDWCGEMCRPSSTLGYIGHMVNCVYVVLAWVGGYVGIKYYRQLQLQTEAALAARATAHQAQLKMLRYQLNPHFLFNTLNAISTLVLDGDRRTANRMVQGLSSFLRHSLENDPMQRVTLKQELDALNLYLGIEKLRFADRLRLHYEIAPDCYRALLPSLLLQPLIENAIKYAVARQVEGGTLEIQAIRDAQMLQILVRDDGPGISASNGTGSGSGVGLANTRERLTVLYGDRQTFQVRERAPHGAEILIRIPFEAAAPAAGGEPLPGVMA
ncbi:MAG TPA: histidine kinase [Xanthomonadaceae bacterium]|nr:histidine kinase [Xanthomonadaceae bacterium]